MNKFYTGVGVRRPSAAAIDLMSDLANCSELEGGLLDLVDGMDLTSLLS